MNGKLLSFLRIIHYSIPSGMQTIYMCFFTRIRKLRYLVLPVDLCTGNEIISSDPLKIAYIGWDAKICRYWMKRILGEKYSVEREKKILVRNVYKYLIKNKTVIDLAIIEMNGLTKKYAKSDFGFLLPRWLEMQLDYDKTLKTLTKQGILRSINKHSLTFEKKSNIKDLKFFYERMYIPYITKRHKDTAVISDFGYYLNLIRRKGSQLFFIIKDGEYIAGFIDEVRGNNKKLNTIGILDGREDIMKMGVTGAIYYYVLLDSNEKGISSVNIGGTSPVLTDGLTQFKHRHGGRIADLNYLGDNLLWLVPLSNNLGIKNILKNNPFIYKLKNDFYRAVFTDCKDFNDKNDFLRIIKYSACRNIKQTRIYCFNGADQISEWLKETEYEQVDVINYNISNSY